MKVRFHTRQDPAHQKLRAVGHGLMQATESSNLAQALRRSRGTQTNLHGEKGRSRSKAYHFCAKGRKEIQKKRPKDGVPKEAKPSCMSGRMGLSLVNSFEGVCSVLQCRTRSVIAGPTTGGVNITAPKSPLDSPHFESLYKASRSHFGSRRNVLAQRVIQRLGVSGGRWRPRPLPALAAVGRR